MKTATLSEAAFDAAAAAAGLELSPDDRAIALAEARKLHRSAARVRAYVAAAECTRPT